MRYRCVTKKAAIMENVKLEYVFDFNMIDALQAEFLVKYKGRLQGFGQVV